LWLFALKCSRLEGKLHQKTIGLRDSYRRIFGTIIIINNKLAASSKIDYRIG